MIGTSFSFLRRADPHRGEEEESGVFTIHEFSEKKEDPSPYSFPDVGGWEEKFFTTRSNGKERVEIGGRNQAQNRGKREGEGKSGVGRLISTCRGGGSRESLPSTCEWRMKGRGGRPVGQGKKGEKIGEGGVQLRGIKATEGVGGKAEAFPVLR